MVNPTPGSYTPPLVSPSTQPTNPTLLQQMTAVVGNLQGIGATGPYAGPFISVGNMGFLTTDTHTMYDGASGVYGLWGPLGLPDAPDAPLNPWNHVGDTDPKFKFMI